MEHPSRISCRFRAFYGFGLFGLVLLMCSPPAAARPIVQKRDVTAPPCIREDALDAIRQQIAASKLIENPAQRISVLIRAADLLWPHKQTNARGAFTEAFEIAERTVKEEGGRQKSDSRTVVSQVDPRYRVIVAIAKRDLVWAKELIEKLLRIEAEESETDKDHRSNDEMAAKLLGAATMLLSSDTSAALVFAKRSLAFPVNLALPIFLYRLAEVNQGAADNLYREALLTYRQKPMNEFLYLSAYPFGNSRDAGDMPAFTQYRVSPSFVPNNSLQRLFAQTLLERVRQTTGDSTAISPDQSADISQMWLALTRLEGEFQLRLPDLSAAAQDGRAQLFTLLSQDIQRTVQQNVKQETPAGKASFDEQVETAQKEPNTKVRDQILVFAIIGASEKESLEQLLTASDKISDSKLREQLLDWLYFNRTQIAIREKRIDDARKLAAKVQELDQRAYLSSEIAKEWLDKGVDQTRAQEILDEVVTVALKAPNTIVTARTLLAVGFLYLKIDLNRSKAVFSDAVRSINRIESPDFSSQVLIRSITGADFGTYAVYQTPGFDPENGFRELGKRDLDAALSQASQINDNSLRALTTLVLYEVCLQRSEPPRKAPARRAKG